MQIRWRKDLGLVLGMLFMGSIAGPAVATDLESGRNQILKITEQGVVPQILRMKRADSIVFFLNDTEQTPINLELKFGEKQTHCSSGSLVIGAGGIVTTESPILPRNFETVCFPGQGSYPLIVNGLKSFPKGATATIIVE